MSDRLIIHKTALAEWHRLVNDVQAMDATVLEEAVESYLVFLLMRFTTQPDCVKSILALEFIENLQNPRQIGLRDVGDKCLLFSGLFPEQAERRRVSVDYFIEMGQGAYRQLTQFPEREWQGPYATLCEDFVPLMKILRRTREIHREKILQQLGALKGDPDILH